MTVDGTTVSRSPVTSYQVRDELVDLLERDLVGPWGGSDETVEGNPRARYLTGALAPIKVDPDAEPTQPVVAATEATIDTMRAGEQAMVATDTGPGAAPGVPEADDGSVEAADSEDDDQDKTPTSKMIAPSSMGLRFQVPVGVAPVRITARWGQYTARREQVDDRTVTRYDRTLHEHHVDVDVSTLSTLEPAEHVVVDGQAKVSIEVFPDPTDEPTLLIVEVALQNTYTTDGSLPPAHWMFQTELEVIAVDGSDVFLPVNDVRRDSHVDPDPEIARLDLLYRDRLEFAIGRTTSARWSTVEPADDGGEWRRDLAADGRRTANRVGTTWLPTAEVPLTVPDGSGDVELVMDVLAHADAAQVEAGLTPLVDGYDAWLRAQREKAATLEPHLQGIAEEALEDAEIALRRLREGLATVVTNPQALTAFQFMNRVMRDQRVRSEIVRRRAADASLSVADATADVEARGAEAASWRHFQLGFVLLQIPALTDPAAPRRSGVAPTAELLFFPTGGGKTEAYLGLTAFTFGIRRLQGLVESSDGPLDGGDGVAVLMRYTLRLLTSQQFQRATALVCAAELARREDTATWGDEPFRIGLWVGTSVSPKRFAEARRQIDDARADDGNTAYGVTVLQIQRCPWCGEKISPRKHIRADADTQRILVYCGNVLGSRCPFAQGGQVADGLPVLTVDEEIYRHPPTFLLATVDKFARLAREGEAASLFGYVAEHCPRHGYRHPDTATTACAGGRHNAKGSLPAVTVQRVRRLRPPDLVIQDELHLITGALGTAVGLFETAVDTLASWETASGSPVHPLVVASTATSRNAGEQVRRLYGRGVDIFPPQVLDIADTYFSREVPVSPEHPGRRYLGVCAHGAKLTLAEIRVSEVLLLAGQKLLDAHGVAADPYATLVDYFSATRELAGMRRYLDDDVATRISNPGKTSGYPRRGAGGLVIGELTSRIASAEITKTLDRLGAPFDSDWDTTESGRRRAALADEARRAGKRPPRRPGDRPFDVVLATSMLQVGVDVGRLGLMLVVGQPKNTAEYIQASSRVGREPDRPGLVVTLTNRARPRDMAHYEQFEHYHRSFYRHVEALSVTPFSDSSLERGLMGVLVSTARVLDVGRRDESLSPNLGAVQILPRRATMDDLVERLVSRVVRAGGDDQAEEARAKLVRRLDAWYERARAWGQLAYDRAKDVPKLLVSPETGSPTGDDAYFRVANSMREVQPEISLVVRAVNDEVTETEPTDAPEWDFPAMAAR